MTENTDNLHLIFYLRATAGKYGKVGVMKNALHINTEM
nr:MAG TPA: hypothetical protein [Bacteriophage sp.]